MLNASVRYRSGLMRKCSAPLEVDSKRLTVEMSKAQVQCDKAKSFLKESALIALTYGGEWERKCPRKPRCYYA